MNDRPLHWPSILQFGGSIFAVLVLWGLSLLVFGAGIIQIAREGGFTDLDIANFVLAFGLFFIGALILPSAGYAFRRLGSPDPKKTGKKWVFKWWVILLFPVIVLVGSAVGAADIPWVSSILLPPLHALAIALPIFWFISIGLRGLTRASGQRSWGVFGVGLTAGPLIILIIEAISAVILIIVVVAINATDTAFVNDLTALTTLTGEPSLEEILVFAETHLLKPWIFALGYVFIAMLVPVVEEIFKSLGVWFLLGKKITPQTGFAMGMIGGAGFALFESLFQPFEAGGWAFLVTVRAGTSIVHILTAGLTGWGLALAPTEGGVLKFLGRFALAVGLHGLWNGLTFTAVLAEIATDSPVRWLSTGSTIAIFVLAVISFAAINRINRKLMVAEAVTADGVPNPDGVPDSVAVPG